MRTCRYWAVGVGQCRSGVLSTRWSKLKWWEYFNLFFFTANLKFCWLSTKPAAEEVQVCQLHALLPLFLQSDSLFTPLVHTLLLCGLYFIDLDFLQKKKKISEWIAGDGVKHLFLWGAVLVKSCSVLWWSKASRPGNKTPSRTTALWRIPQGTDGSLGEHCCSKPFDLFMSLKGTLEGWAYLGDEEVQCVSFVRGGKTRCFRRARWACPPYT